MSGHAVHPLVKLPLTSWGVWPAGIQHIYNIFIPLPPPPSQQDKVVFVLIPIPWVTQCLGTRSFQLRWCTTAHSNWTVKLY